MKPLIIRADATSHIGTGHIMRCIALGQAWHDNGGEVTFISHCESEDLRQRLLEEGMNLINIEKAYPAANDLECTLENIAAIGRHQAANCWLVIDGYYFDASYQKRIKEAGYKILRIDDYGHADHYCADIVLNQNISADESFYMHREPHTKLLLGTGYVLLRREFKRWHGWQRSIPDIASKVLVTMGGADPDNVTLKVIQALKQIDIPGLEAKIVVGHANPNLTILESAISDRTNLQLIKSASNMPELMAWSDIAVSAGGSTCWEMAFMGLPNIFMIIADNQRAVAEELHKQSIAFNMGWGKKILIADLVQHIKSLLLSKDLRKEYSIKSSQIIDSLGSQRVCNEMH
ncbi:MAG: UDP-2,4-diacetamido-2,4,6-trideoxy-beta-L-altropyranose hydrolase [Syntrophaceae bacterium]|nr:UDP-2,4-diacetamido-2,4,6-trideoxy-beta-L-altropyranose hydrolase [Syntrophaceae bacterium]